MINTKDVKKFFTEHLSSISADTLGWLAIILLHCSTVPTLLALLTHLSDKTPSVDIILFVWAGLVLLFGRSVLLKDTLNSVTNALGFIVQAVLLALIVFK